MVSGINASGLIGRSPGGRKLIAVVHADMVGYSRLIGLDDVGTLERLRSLRANLIDPAIDEHGGRIVNTGGDSLLIVFDSIDGAVRCAVKVQQQMPAHDGDQPPERMIRFRVGINVGDVIPDGTDVHGDVVNVAARLQAECPLGGICVSRGVRDHVQDRLDLAFEELGPIALKNIARPVEAFVLKLDVVAAPKSVEQSLLRGRHESLPLPDKPSIAVLAFTNMSDDPDQEYFSDGIAEDITTELSRSRSLFVIARNSSFTYRGRAVDVRQIARELGVRYVLEGSVRRAGGRVRVTAQLIDAETGNHIWAERYDRTDIEIFAVQDEITGAMAMAIDPAIAHAERQRAIRKPPESLGAWEAYQRALWHLSRPNMEDNELARSYFQKAIHLDAASTSAYSGLAVTYLRDTGFYLTRSVSESMQLAEPVARQAVELDPDDATALGVHSVAMSFSGFRDAAVEQAYRAIAISPNCAYAYHALGWSSLFRGDWKTAQEAFETSLRLNPRDPMNQIGPVGWSIACYLGHDYEHALTAARRALAVNPNFPMAHRWVAAALGQLDNRTEAMLALRRAEELDPSDLDAFVQRPPQWLRPEDHRHVLDGLRKAGWQG
jgi:adenylate cyclase